MGNTDSPVDIDVRHRINHEFLRIRLAIVAAQVPGKETQDGNVLGENQALVLQCRHLACPGNSPLLELLAVLGPGLIVWIASLFDLDSRVHEEQLDYFSAAQATKIEVVVDWHGGRGSHRD